MFIPTLFMGMALPLLTIAATSHLDDLGKKLGTVFAANTVGNLCGAIGNYEWIEQPDIPIVSMHGDQDSVVPYSDNLITLFGLDVDVYGSYIIHETMIELGNYSSLHTYIGEDHTPFTADMSFETEFSSQFLYEIVCNNLDLVIGDINLDEEINILDVIILINFILENEYPTPDQILISDINDDNELNILDVIMLVNLILDN